MATGLLVRSSREGYGFKWVANFCSCFEQPIFYTFAAWVLRILIGGEEKNIIVYQFARIFFMVMCRGVEWGEGGGEWNFFPEFLGFCIEGGEGGFGGGGNASVPPGA